MGHDHQQSSSSGAVVAIVVAVLLVGIIGLLAVVGVGLFFVRTTSSNYSRAVDIAEANRAVAEELRAKGEAIQAVVQEQRAEATPQIRESSVGAIPDPILNFEVQIDREGNLSVDGEGTDLGELRARLTKLKDETSKAFSVLINADPFDSESKIAAMVRSKAFSVLINADPECPVKLLIPVLDACEEVGDINFTVVVAAASDVERP